jgi:hypothetical protein
MPPTTHAQVGIETEFFVVVVTVLIVEDLATVSCAMEISVVRPSIIKRKRKM